MTQQFGRQKWIAAATIVGAIAIFAACGGGSANKASISKNTAPGGATSGQAASGGGGAGATTSGAPRDSGSAANSAELSAQKPVAGAPSTDGSTGTIAGNGDAGGANPLSLPSQLDRKIIMTATLDLTADEVSKRFEDVGNIAASAGGFIASSTFGNSGKDQTASVTIRIPASNYQRTLSDLRRLGEVKGEQSNANDVTEDYTDLQSRLRNLSATEQQYIQFLLKAQDLNQVLTVQDRLNATRAQIEQVQGRINLVDHQSDLATITVHLTPPVVAKVDEPKKASATRSPLEVANDSFQASLVVLLGIATVTLAVAAFSWWLVPVIAGGYLIARRQSRPGRERQAPPPAASA